MSIFTNRQLALSVLRQAGTGEDLLKVLDMIAEDVKSEEKAAA